MTSQPLARRIAGVLCLVAVSAAAACGDDEDASVDARSEAPEQLEADFLPSRLLGLNVEQEDQIDEVAAARGTYLDALGLYSVRDGDLLQATLQIGRFDEDADYIDDRFRRSIVGQIGSTAPKSYRMGDQQVWLTTGKSQRVSVWFEDDLFFVLAVRDDFERGRSLLRETLELKK